MIPYKSYHNAIANLKVKLNRTFTNSNYQGSIIFQHSGNNVGFEIGDPVTYFNGSYRLFGLIWKVEQVTAFGQNMCNIYIKHNSWQTRGSNSGGTLYSGEIATNPTFGSHTFAEPTHLAETAAAEVHVLPPEAYEEMKKAEIPTDVNKAGFLGNKTALIGVGVIVILAALASKYLK